jgi:hypothetical protein
MAQLRKQQRKPWRYQGFHILLFRQHVSLVIPVPTLCDLPVFWERPTIREVPRVQVHAQMQVAMMDQIQILLGR